MGNENQPDASDGQVRPELTVPASQLPIPHSPMVVGLVGGIGSGKSQVAAAFAARGARVISGDELAHEALRQADVKELIARRFGRDVLDERGEVKRARLAAIVFGDPAELRALEAITHPWIKDGIRRSVEAARHDPAVRLIVLDAAIMLEAGWNGICDRLVFINASEEERRRRVAGQRGWTAEQLGARERAQLPLTAKAARADHTLDNSGSLERLGRQVDELLRQWGVASPSPRAAASGE